VNEKQYHVSRNDLFEICAMQSVESLAMAYRDLGYDSLVTCWLFTSYAVLFVVLKDWLSCRKV